MRRVILKEVKDHLHELFHIGTKGVDEMRPILKVRVTSGRLADINQSVTQHCMHCQPKNLANAYDQEASSSASNPFTAKQKPAAKRWLCDRQTSWLLCAAT